MTQIRGLRGRVIIDEFAFVPSRPRLIEMGACYDIRRGEGRVFWLRVLGSPNLMTRPGDEGRLLLAGLEFTVTVRAPWGWTRDSIGWRRPLLFSVRSDADEIAHRQAEASGWVTR